GPPSSRESFREVYGTLMAQVQASRKHTLFTVYNGACERRDLPAYDSPRRRRPRQPLHASTHGGTDPPRLRRGPDRPVRAPLLLRHGDGRALRRLRARRKPHRHPPPRRTRRGTLRAGQRREGAPPGPPPAAGRRPDHPLRRRLVLPGKRDAGRGRHGPRKAGLQPGRGEGATPRFILRRASSGRDRGGWGRRRRGRRQPRRPGAGSRVRGEDYARRGRVRPPAQLAEGRAPDLDGAPPAPRGRG
ncbi:MAG: hypothetical protein AVDCRST_MAG01-01-4582, partial [uncultured Rubrobacteraceae bacterium]